MNIEDAIYKRRTIRKFKQDPVSYYSYSKYLRIGSLRKNVIMVSKVRYKNKFYKWKKSISSY